MKTKSNSPKSPTKPATAKSASPSVAKAFSIMIPRAAERLAKQMGTTPQMILARAIWRGIHDMDWCLGVDYNPFADGGYDVIPSRIITARANRLSDEQLKAMKRRGRVPQKVILEAASKQQLKEHRKQKSDEMELAERIVPFYGSQLAEVDA